MQTIDYQVNSDSFITTGLCVREPYQPYNIERRGLYVMGGKKRYYLSEPFAGVYLTEQEVRCLIYFVRGLSYKEIAALLVCADTTISTYFVSVARKLHCVDKKQLQTVITKEKLMQRLWEMDAELGGILF